MARRQIAGGKYFSVIPDTYARTTGVWQTRQGRFNREFATFAQLRGLNTAYDELNKREGDSPYLRNVRFMGERQPSQRAQVTSRAGARLITSIGDVDSIPDESLGQTILEVWEGKAIEFDIDFTNTLVGGGLYVRNKEGAKGVLLITLKKNGLTEPICQAIIRLPSVDNQIFEYRDFKFIKALKATQSSGRATLRIEVFDDIDMKQCLSENPIRGAKVEILASAGGSHQSAEYVLPNVNECLKEQPYQFINEPGTPLFGKTTNANTPMKKGIWVTVKDITYLVFPMRTPTTVELWRVNMKTGLATLIDNTIPVAAKTVRFDTAGGDIYYVDGVSVLKRIKTDTWTTEVALALPANIDAPGVTPAQVQAKPGASLILFLRNRLYLSGFADDPNFVQFSLINSLGAQYDQFNEAFYSPDRSPQDTANRPITALAQIENNLAVFRRDGNSLFSAPSGLEFGRAQQLDTFANNLGVANQENLTEANGSIYLFNRSEGFRRYAGADASFTSSQIENELVSNNIENSFMIYHKNKVRFYYDRSNSGSTDHCLVYHTILSGGSPWYMDNQVPVSWAVSTPEDFLFAMHADYPAVYEIDAKDQFTDFDCVIPMEYHTNYKSPGSAAGWTILRRVVLRTIASSTHSWFVGVDLDHRDNPAVWRRVVTQTTDDPEISGDIFNNTAPAETNHINLFLRAKCHDFNVRTKVLCYNGHAELQYIETSYGGKDIL